MYFILYVFELLNLKNSYYLKYLKLTNVFLVSAFNLLEKLNIGNCYFHKVSDVCFLNITMNLLWEKLYFLVHLFSSASALWVLLQGTTECHKRILLLL